MFNLLSKIKTAIFGTGTTPSVQTRDDNRQEEARRALEDACQDITRSAVLGTTTLQSHAAVTPMASGTVTADTVIAPSKKGGAK